MRHWMHVGTLVSSSVGQIVEQGQEERQRQMRTHVGHFKSKVEMYFADSKYITEINLLWVIFNGLLSS